jgi:hypothetical protein
VSSSSLVFIFVYIFSFNKLLKTSYGFYVARNISESHGNRNRNTTLLVSLDFSSAFDFIDHNILYRILLLVAFVALVKLLSLWP